MREQAFCFHVCSTHLLMSRLSSGLGPSRQMCSFKNRNLPCFPQGAWGVGHVCPVWRGNEDLSSEVSQVSIWDCVVSLCLCGAGLLGVWLTCLIYCDAFETHTHQAIWAQSSSTAVVNEIPGGKLWTNSSEPEYFNMVNTYRIYLYTNSMFFSKKSLNFWKKLILKCSIQLIKGINIVIMFHKCCSFKLSIH